ncbi:MAG TPA: hypothetical protein VF144_17420 [Chitinophagaceae bacterium]
MTNAIPDVEKGSSASSRITFKEDKLVARMKKKGEETVTHHATTRKTV